MKEPYYREFWIISDNGDQLYPKLIRNMDTGKLRYQLLADGSNRKEDGDETDDPLEAVVRFLKGESLRFGNENTTANRFKINGGHVKQIGMSTDFLLSSDIVNKLKVEIQ
ncbi:hypothetical protein [Pseudochrobactrum sp. HB0163]|uniref:hypothetical protein n=1 Tax=Pseudochrobactrum sp. HB0163 TaxID=3450708 RepID=UPI003F6DE6D3